MYTIELDCAPGGIRPNDLLPGVLKDTGITIDPDNTVSRFFGNWKWEVPNEQTQAYEAVRETVKDRIETLYHSGVIRYGSW
jgi:hypothetical protein